MRIIIQCFWNNIKKKQIVKSTMPVAGAGVLVTEPPVFATHANWMDLEESTGCQKGFVYVITSFGVPEQSLLAKRSCVTPVVEQSL